MLKLLKKFLAENPEGQKTFRYFKSRKLHAITNHIITILLAKDNNIVGYGHLDQENNKIWLGIFIGDKHKGQGYGKTILKELISHADGKTIFLSVDKDNIAAQSLYQKAGFKLVEQREKINIMSLDFPISQGIL